MQCFVDCFGSFLIGELQMHLISAINITQKKVAFLIPQIIIFKQNVGQLYIQQFLYIFLMKTTFIVLAFLATLTIQQLPPAASPYALIPNQIEPETPAEATSIEKPVSNQSGHLRRNDQDGSQYGHEKDSEHKTDNKPTPESKVRRQPKPPGPNSQQRPPKDENRQKQSKDLEEPSRRKHDRKAHDHSQKKKHQHDHSDHSDQPPKQLKERDEEWAKRREEKRKSREANHQKRQEEEKMNEQKPKSKSQQGSTTDQKDRDSHREQRNSKDEKRRRKSWENMRPEQMMPAANMPPPPPPPKDRPLTESRQDIQTNEVPALLPQMSIRVEQSSKA